MGKSVYIETSFISFLTARRSRHILLAAWQQATIDWWLMKRTRFDLYTSELVIMEASRGDCASATKRLEALQGIRRLEITCDSRHLAKLLLEKGALPQKALDDALHIAIAASHKIDYLLTWNCRHINNAEIKPLFRSVCDEKGFLCPEVCTPLELMGPDYDY